MGRHNLSVEPFNDVPSRKAVSEFHQERIIEVIPPIVGYGKALLHRAIGGTAVTLEEFFTDPETSLRSTRLLATIHGVTPTEADVAIAQVRSNLDYLINNN